MRSNPARCAWTKTETRPIEAIHCLARPIGRLRRLRLERGGWDGVKADHPVVIQAAAGTGIADQPPAAERDRPYINLASSLPTHPDEELG
jgi:hypothetical protein